MKMKKLLAAMISMILLLNISLVSAADKQTGLKNGEVDKMYSFGLIRDPHVFEMDQEVSRGEAAYAFEKMIGYDVTADKKNTPISDAEKNINENEIYKVYSLGLMPCVYGKNFLPDKAVSYGDILRASAKLLGYSENVVGKNADFNAYLKAMSAGGAVKNVIKGENDSVTWSEFLRFLDTVLEADMYEIVPEDESTKIQRTNKNILNDRLNIYECEGIMTKNEFSSLSDTQTLAEGDVQIGSMILTGCKENTLELLGMNLKAWYRDDPDADEENVLLYLCQNDRNSEILRVNSYDVDSLTIGELQYNIGRKTKRQAFPTGIYILYNGVAVSDYTDWEIKCDNGSVSLIDNNGDGKYDVLSIINYEESVVYSKTDDGKIYDLHSADRNMDFSDEKIRYYKDGASAKYEDIRTYDVVSALKSKDGTVIEVIITTNAVSGRIRSVSDVELNGYASEVVIDGTSFYTLKSFEKVFDNTIRFGLAGTFYLDFNGCIVGYTKGTTDFLYAYVVKVTYAEDEGVGEGEIYLKLFNQDGVTNTYTLPEKVNLNGKSCKDTDKILENIRESSVIKYKITEEGVINWIETAYNNTDASNPDNNKDGYLKEGDEAPEDRLRVTYSKLNDTETYINAMGMLGDKARVSNKTIFFKVPKDINERNEIFFSVGKRTMLADAQKVEFQTYASSKDAIDNDVCVIFENTNYSGSSFLKQVATGFVEKVYTTVNDNDEVRTVVKLVSNTGNATLMEYEEGYFGKVRAQKTSISDEYTLQKGDIIRYLLNANGNIVYAELLYRMSDGTIQNMNGGQGIVDDFSMRMGYVYKRQGGDVALVDKAPSDSTTRADWRVFNMEKTKVYIYDDKNLTAGTLDDLVSYSTSKTDYSMGVLHSMWGQPQVFYIYKK